MILKDKRISIIGFGNQGLAWALNMRDSGLNVKVALRAGSKSTRKANEHKIEVLNLRQGFVNSDIICILTPDETHQELFEKYGPNLEDGQSIVFAHGYNIHYKLIKIEKNADILLVAPKGTGESLRNSYLKDSGIPCLIAVEKDATGNAWQIAKSIAESLGCHRAGIYKSTFKEETEINLFTEQAFYLSVLPQTIYETFNTLIEAGYSREASYCEALNKVKIFGDLIQKHGLFDAYQNVSSIARVGGILSQGRLINEGFKKELRKILKEIQDGTFLKKFSEEQSTGAKNSQAFLEILKDSTLEATGKKLREKLFKNE